MWRAAGGSGPGSERGVGEGLWLWLFAPPGGPPPGLPNHAAGRPAGAGDRDVAGAEGLEFGLEAVAGVGVVVVAHDRLGRPAAELPKPGGGAPERRGGRVAILACVQLRVGESGAVVDD